MPVLDNMTYMEEITWMPQAIPCEVATHILLASSDRFYLYLVEFDELFHAGSTLKDVYEGLRQTESVSTMSGCPCQDVEPLEERWPDHLLHFPDYTLSDRKLLYEVVPFIRPATDAALPTPGYDFRISGF